MKKCKTSKEYIFEKDKGIFQRIKDNRGWLRKKMKKRKERKIKQEQIEPDTSMIDHAVRHSEKIKMAEMERMTKKDPIYELLFETRKDPKAIFRNHRTMHGFKRLNKWGDENGNTKE